MCEQVYGLLLRDIGGGAPTRSARENSLLSQKNPNVWGDCPANQLASPSPQASLFCAAYSFRGYASEVH